MLLLGMLFGAFPLFSQNKSLKDIERLIDQKAYESAKIYLEEFVMPIDEISEDQKAYFYYLNAKVFLFLAQESKDKQTDIEQVILYRNELQAYESSIKSEKYSNKLEPLILGLKKALVNQAIAKNADKILASRQLEEAYRLNPQDTLYLYYSASVALQAKDYDFAESKYKDLVLLNYDGKSTIFTAKNKSTNKIVSFGFDEIARNDAIKSGTHTESKDIEQTGKKPEIYKNLALILLGKKNYFETEIYLHTAYNLNREDKELLLSLMDLYLKTNRLHMFEKYLNEAIEKYPEDKVFLYNLGIIAFKNKDYPTAKTYFTRATSEDSKIDEAFVMLANLELLKDSEITKELNKLVNQSNSVRYKKLYKQKKEMYEKALYYLDKALLINPKNTKAISFKFEINTFLGIN